MRNFSLILILFLFSFSLFAQDSRAEKKKNRGGIIAYNAGVYAPFGAVAGRTFAKGHGFYISLRFNANTFTKADYYFDRGGINDRSLAWQYDGGKKYSRGEINAGAIIKIYRKDSWGLKVYGGLGYMSCRYIYSYSQRGIAGSTDQVWVEYKELGGAKFNTEGGLIFFFMDNLNVQLGLSSINLKNERMITFGIGVGVL